MPARPHARMPVLVATAPSPSAVAVHRHAHAAAPVGRGPWWRPRARGPSPPCRRWARPPGPRATGRGRPASTPSGVARPLNSSGSPNCGVVARLGQRLEHHGLVERAGVGEALAVVDDHPHPDAGRAGLREALHLAAVGLHRRAGAAGDVGLDLLAGPGLSAMRAATSSSSGLAAPPLGGAADGEGGHPQGGHAVADRHALAVLAAHAGAAHGEVVARRRRCWPARRGRCR